MTDKLGTTFQSLIRRIKEMPDYPLWGEVHTNLNGTSQFSHMGDSVCVTVKIEHFPPGHLPPGDFRRYRAEIHIWSKATMNKLTVTDGEMRATLAEATADYEAYKRTAEAYVVEAML